MANETVNQQPATKNETVTKQQKQLHFEKVRVVEPPITCNTKLYIFGTIGIFALLFLIVVAVCYDSMAPRHKEMNMNLQEIDYEGFLVAYPQYLNPESSYGMNDSYLISLLVQDLSETTKTLQDMISSYPNAVSGSGFTNCWVQEPEFYKPCFFDRSWLKSICTESDSFGYKMTDGKFNPCVILRLEQTKTWVPIPMKKAQMSKKLRKYHNTEFAFVYCYPKIPSHQSKITDIQVSPAKGFAKAFFPAANFNTESYLLPAVAVKIYGISKGDNVTIRCTILAENSPTLKNYGLVDITFQAEHE